MADVVFYASPFKQKSRKMAQMMAAGMGWPVSMGLPFDASRAACFYGVTGDTLGLFRAALQSRQPYFYVDHAYFGRGTYYRMTCNAVQHSGLGETDGARWRAQGIDIQPWRRDGRHILVCPQSEAWHAWMMPDSAAPGDWANDVCEQLRLHTDRPIIVRHKPQHARFANPDALVQSAESLAEALRDAWAVVVHQSGVGVHAAIAGVPVFSLGDCAVNPVACRDLALIESPRYVDDDERLRWLGVLADNQWTREEIQNGTLRKIFNERYT